MAVKPSAFEEFAKSKTKAKAEARKLDISDLKKLVISLSEALDAEQKKQKEKEEKDRLAKIAKINEMLAENGLKPEDLKKAGSGKRGRKPGPKAGAKRGPVPTKYRLVVDGKTHEWTGRGRTPKVFQAYFDAGNSRESVEI